MVVVHQSIFSVKASWYYKSTCVFTLFALPPFAVVFLYPVAELHGKDTGEIHTECIDKTTLAFWVIHVLWWRIPPWVKLAGDLDCTCCLVSSGCCNQWKSGSDLVDSQRCAAYILFWKATLSSICNILTCLRKQLGQLMEHFAVKGPNRNQTKQTVPYFWLRFSCFLLVWRHFFPDSIQIDWIKQTDITIVIVDLNVLKYFVYMKHLN